MNVQGNSISDSAGIEQDGKWQTVVMIADPKEVLTANPEAPLVDDGDVFWNAERGAETIHWTDPANEYTTSGYTVDVLLERHDNLGKWEFIRYDINDTDCLDCNNADDRAALAQIIWHGIAAAYTNLKSIRFQFENTAAGCQLGRIDVFLSE